MYGYSSDQVIPLTVDDILKQYTQEDIFRMVFGEYPDLGELYLSPFRPDRNPNCFFEWYKGRLMFRDYADVRRDCFQAVMDYHGHRNIVETFRHIIDYFSENPIPPESYQKFHQQAEQRETQETMITVVGRNFTSKDILYWKQYQITPEHLLSDMVTPVSKFRLYSRRSKEWSVIRPYDITYAIRGFEKRVKIYRPLYKGKTGKWITNCKPDDIGNLQNIDKKDDILIITKSYKDHRVIRNMGYNNVIWFQSEKMFPSPAILYDLSIRFKRIFIFYDNDSTGFEGAYILRQHFLNFNKPATIIYSPYRLFKDPAEIVSVKGSSELQNLLWKYCRK